MPSGQCCHIKVALKRITLARDLSSSMLPPDKVSEHMEGWLPNYDRNYSSRLTVKMRINGGQDSVSLGWLIYFYFYKKKIQFLPRLDFYEIDISYMRSPKYLLRLCKRKFTEDEGVDLVTLKCSSVLLQFLITNVFISPVCHDIKHGLPSVPGLLCHLYLPGQSTNHQTFVCHVSQCFSLLFLWCHCLFRDKVWPYSTQCRQGSCTCDLHTITSEFWDCRCAWSPNTIFVCGLLIPLCNPTLEVTVLSFSYACIPRDPRTIYVPFSLWWLLWNGLFRPLFHKVLDLSFWFYFPASVIHTCFVLVPSSHLWPLERMCSGVPRIITVSCLTYSENNFCPH